jgi:hypothetical protein
VNRDGSEPRSAAEREAPDDEPSAAAENDAQARQTLLAFAVQERSERVHGGYGLLISGAAAGGAGLLAELEFEQSYGRPIWIAGAALGVSGLLSFLKPGPLQSFETESAPFRGAAFQRKWAALARRAARARHITGAINLGVAALGIGTGSALAAGVGGLGRAAKENWSLALILVGGGLASSGVVTLLVESKAELGYRAAYGEAPDDDVALEVGALALPRGGGVSVSGAF